jgi:hypothetical protein
MELAKIGVKHVGIPLAIGALTGGVGAIPAATAMLMTSVADSGAKSDEEASAEEINWASLIREKPGEPDILEIRKFRQDFQEMIDKTDIKSLIILIDDLDRCLPERIIETLEAIKLFVAVPKTAFIIGADPRIVRHAIATRYVRQQVGDDRQEEYDLVQDYLEKLIQIPYHLPRLSPPEIETYINLLACQKHLNAAQCQTVLNNWSAKRTENFYAAYRHAGIREALGGGDAVTEELERQLSWSNSIAAAITEGLKGNPRQVKRMLNAMLLRKELARVAGIQVKDEILSKLMVLEYAYLPRFHELNDWQASEAGYPEKLKKLETWALAEDERRTALDESLNEWKKPSMKNWLRMAPALSEVDLRDYFWLARDRTGSTLAGIEMVSPIVRRLFDQLMAENEGEQYIAVREVLKLEETDQLTLLGLLKQQVESHPDQMSGPDALFKLAEHDLSGAAEALFASISDAPHKLLAPGIAFKIETLGKKHTAFADPAKTLLRRLSGKETKIGKAAEKSLKGWEEDGDLERLRTPNRR